MTYVLSVRSYVALSTGVILVGVALHATALAGSFSVDDYAQQAMMRGVYPVARAPLALFTFSAGDAAENVALKEAGFLPWWSHEALRISMFRPLSSAMLWLDLKAFGFDPFGYHLHSLLWWVLMLALLAALLRRLLPSPVALLALLLFTLDEGHGPLLGWIAMRNATIASAFALLGLLAQLRKHQDGQPAGSWLALAIFALALCASEYAIAFLGYALLCELQFAQSSAQRLRAVLPWLGLLCVYFAVRAALGFGVRHSGMYIDPLAESVEFLRQAVLRFPVLAGDLVLSSLRANWWTSGFPPLRSLQQWAGVLAMGLALPLLIVATRTQATPAARFLIIGTPLALLPMLAALPESRLLLPAWMGFSVALASALWRYLLAFRTEARRPAILFALLSLAAFTLYHLTLPPFFAAHEQRTASQLSHAVRASILAPELEAPFRNAKHVLLLDAADPTTSIYIPIVRRLHQRPWPAAYHLLSATSVPQRLTRLSDRAFRLARLLPGYTPGDAYFSAFNSTKIYAGQVFEVPGLRVRVEQTSGGLPTRTHYEFDLSLDDPGVVLLTQTASGLLRHPFPAQGRSVDLAAPFPPVALMPH